MRTILVHSLSGSNNRMFDANERDNYNDPAIYLRERLFTLGYELTTADNNALTDCEWVLFNDASSVKAYSGWRGLARRVKTMLNGKTLMRDLYNECIDAGLGKRVALFLWEAPAVSPENWDHELHRLFPIIFTWHDAFIDNRKVFKIYWPQTRQFPEVPKIAFRERELLVNISMNKTSCHPRELYSARRTSIRHFERTHPESFDLFGVGWDRPSTLMERYVPFTWQAYPSYRGTVKNKWEVLPYYRFSLCYENIRDEPGWITEKIFDAMRCGCVPIYWGAPNISDYVDADAFIDRRHFRTDEELEEYLVGVSDVDYACFQDAIRSFLNSKRFALFLPPNYADTIINKLGLTHLGESAK